MTPGKEHKRNKKKRKFRFASHGHQREDTRWFIHIWQKTNGDVELLSLIFELSLKQVKQKATDLRKRGIQLCQAKRTINIPIESNDK